MKLGHAAHTQDAATRGLPGAMPRPIKLTMLGAGSGFTPRLLNDLFRIPGEQGGTIALVDIDRDRLATMHRVKGLEFKAVFMACLNEGIVPPEGAHSHTEDPVEQNLLEASERALFHVAATRAVRHLFLSSHGRASRYFLNSGRP